MPSKVRINVTVSIKQVYRDLSNDHLYRVVLTGYGQPKTYLARVDGARIDIRILPSDEFRRLAGRNATATGGYQLVEEPYADLLSNTSSTPGHEWKSADNYKLIEPLLNRETPADLHKFIQLLEGGARRARLCEDLASKSKVQVKKIYKYFRLWLQRGMRPASVSSSYPNCGRLIKSDDGRRHYEKVPGRRSSVPAPQVKLPSATLDKLLARIADCLYTNNQAPWDIHLPEDLRREVGASGAGVPANASARRQPNRQPTRKRGKPGWSRGRRSRASVAAITDRFNFLLRCDRVVRDETGKAIKLDLLDHDAISVHQARHFLKKRSESEKLRRSMGDAEFRSRGRPRRGNALQHCRGPGHVFFIDATIADIFLVSCFDRTVVVGRPTVYFVVDAWSRMVVGLHVSFLPPSFEGAALAMQCMVTPKSVFCAQFGFTISDADWPCRYMPVRFQVDRGCEYIQSRPWKIMIDKFAVGISNNAAYEPFWRGLIECRFGIIPIMAQQHGYAVVESKADAPRGFNPALDALWTRAEFTCELLRAIHIYHRTPIGGDFDTPPKMVAEGKANTPLNRWNYGVENSLAMLESCDIDEVTHAVLFRDDATISTGGLKLDGAYYSSNTTLQRYSAVRKSHGHGEVDVGYSPDDMSRISLSAPYEGPEFVPLSKVNRIDLSQATHLEYEQLRRMNQRNAKAEKVAGEPIRMLHALNSSEDAHKADAEQQAALKAAGKSHPDVKHIRQAKQREATIERELRGPPAIPPVVPLGLGHVEGGQETNRSPLDRLKRMIGTAAAKLLDAPPPKLGGRSRR